MIKRILPFLYLAVTITTALAQPVITFRADMRKPIRQQIFEPALGDTLLIRGTFNQWQGSRNFLLDTDGDSIYTLDFEPAGEAGTEIQYKFVIRKSGGRDLWEHNPDPSNPDHGNRRFRVTGNSVILPVAEFDLAPYLAKPEFRYTVSDLREDFLQLRDSIEALHPALYAFTDRMTFDRIFDQRLSELQAPMSEIAFFRYVAPIVARIGCGHSGIRMPEAWWAAQPDRYFPLRFIILNDTVYTPDLPGDSTTVKEVLAVNDLPLKTMLQQFYRVIPADGYNRGYQRAVLAERFPYYYALYYGFPDTFEIRYRDTANDSVQTTAVAALSNAVLNRSNRPKPALDFELRREPPAAILRIGHFSYYTPDQEAYFRSYIDSVFQIIKDTGTRNLILDVRGNDGGNPFCAAWVLSYIEEEPVPYFDRPFGRYRILAEPVPLAENAFDGELCILIDEKCFSTTGHFTALLKYHDIGTLIGSETGGTYTCNDAKKLVYLKNTGLVLQIARGTFAVAVANMDRGRGVSPDLSVPQDIHDLIQNKDTVLEYALKLLTD